MKSNHARYGVTAMFGSLMSSAVMCALLDSLLRLVIGVFIAALVGFVCAVVIPSGESE